MTPRKQTPRKQTTTKPRRIQINGRTPRQYAAYMTLDNDSDLDKWAKGEHPLDQDVIDQVSALLLANQNDMDDLLRVNAFDPADMDQDPTWRKLGKTIACLTKLRDWMQDELLR